MNNTTQRFHRTMQDAFPHGIDYASSVEHYRRGEPRWAVLIGCTVLGLVFAGLVMWGTA